MHRQVSNVNGIGYRIKELREKRKMSQAELAKLVGCAQTTVAEWERRRDRAPGKRYRAKIAEILEVSIDYLLGIGKGDIPRIPCYGEVSSRKFIWQEKWEDDYYIEIPQGEYNPSYFSLRIMDDLLEPIIMKGDYGIFKKLQPKNGDIVVVRFPEDGNVAMVKMWRQKEEYVVLSETNLDKIGLPYFLEFSPLSDNLVCTEKKAQKTVIVEGKLISVKRTLKTARHHLGINYIFS